MKKDKRITGRLIPWKKWTVIFLLAALLCGGFILIYYKMRAIDDNEFYLALSLLTYVIVSSIYICFCLEMMRRRLLMPPIQRLQEAARKVASGDFSVRIASTRADGKKDEFDVLYEDFNTMAEELSSTELLKKDFVSNVSHELKTPLAVVQNYVSILQSESLTEEEQRQYIKKIGEASRHLSDLVSDILRLSRLENQKIVAHSSSYVLSEQLCRCILGFEQMMDEKEIELEFQPDPGIIITSDEELLDIVWNNLISNALKFSKQGGRLYISMKSVSEGIEVVVEDQGCGISESAIHHIFDKFYQEDSSRATRGNGLGLAMVKEIITMLGAAISVDSTPNVGSRFTVTLPIN